MASSARIVTHVLTDARRYRDAEAFARLMAEKLSATWSTEPANDALAVYGALLLRGAIAAARAGNAASTDLDLALTTAPRGLAGARKRPA
jgi:hypothetical protein